MPTFLKSEKGAIGPILLIALVIAGIGIGVYLLGQRTNLKPKAGGGGTVEFYDGNWSAPIKATDSAQVNVQFNAPWPPLIYADTITEVTGITPGPGGTSGTVGSPTSGKVDAEKSKAQLGNSKNSIVISGRVFSKIKFRSPPKTAKYWINYCDPDKDGVENYAPIGENGTFSFRIAKGQMFCIKPPKLDGYGFPPVAINSLEKGASSYEYQVAGFDCIKKDKKKKQCSDVGSQKYDLRVDDRFDFEYTTLEPTPTPINEVRTKGVEVSENPGFTDSESYAYTAVPLKVSYKFKDVNPGKKVLYVRFHGTNGQAETVQNAYPFPAVVELIGPTASPIPTPTPIVKPFVNITSPNGGESFKVGDRTKITWDASTNIKSFNLGLRFTDVGYELSIFKIADAKSRSFEWTVDDIGYLPDKTKPAIITITAFPEDGKYVQDTSDSKFTISPQKSPYVYITNPVGDVSYKNGSTLRVMWDLKGEVDAGFVLYYEYWNGKYMMPDYLGDPKLRRYDWKIDIGNFGEYKDGVPVRLIIEAYKKGVAKPIATYTSNYFTVTR